MPPLSFGFPAGGLGNRRKVIVASGLIDCGIPFFLKSVICAGPHQKVAVKYVEWTSVEEKFAIFLGFCLDFCAALEVGGSAWKWGIGGPCSHRIATITDCFKSLNFAPITARPPMRPLRRTGCLRTSVDEKSGYANRYINSGASLLPEHRIRLCKSEIFA